MSDRIQLAILGSRRKDLDSSVTEIASQLGKQVAKEGYILITGGATGVSEAAAISAEQNGGTVVVLSPFDQTVEVESVSYAGATAIVRTGMGFKGRNVITVQSADAVVIVNGGFGTINEMTIAHDQRKPIVVMEDSGGAASLIKVIIDHLDPSFPYVHYSKDPIDACQMAEEMVRKSKSKNAVATSMLVHEA